MLRAALLLSVLGASWGGSHVCYDTKSSCPRKVFARPDKCARRTSGGMLGKFPTRCAKSCDVCDLAAITCADKKPSKCINRDAQSLSQLCTQDKFRKKCRLTCGICQVPHGSVVFQRQSWQYYPMCQCNRWLDQSDRTPTAEVDAHRPYLCMKSEPAGGGFYR